jgi:2-methylisocitrate lyase-like PEP mutase family enzyme
LSLDEFRRLGVRRISLGGSLMQAALTFVNDTLAEIRAGSFAFAEAATPSRELANLMAPWWRDAG